MNWFTQFANIFFGNICSSEPYLNKNALNWTSRLKLFKNSDFRLKIKFKLSENLARKFWERKGSTSDVDGDLEDTFRRLSPVDSALTAASGTDCMLLRSVTSNSECYSAFKVPRVEPATRMSEVVNVYTSSWLFRVKEHSPFGSVKNFDRMDDSSILQDFVKAPFVLDGLASKKGAYENNVTLAGEADLTAEFTSSMKTLAECVRGSLTDTDPPAGMSPGVIRRRGATL